MPNVSAERREASNVPLKKEPRSFYLFRIMAFPRRQDKRTKVFPAYQPVNTGLYNALF